MVWRRYIVAEDLVSTALAIAKKRRDTSERLREALKKGETAEALKLAKQLCGVDDEEESPGTHSSIN
jgi:hypothetical protein